MQANLNFKLKIHIILYKTEDFEYKVYNAIIDFKELFRFIANYKELNPIVVKGSKESSYVS